MGAPTDVPTMPVEFSVAAYRLGQHGSGTSTAGTSADFGSASLDLLFDFSGLAAPSGRTAAEQLDRRLSPPLQPRRGRSTTSRSEGRVQRHQNRHAAVRPASPGAACPQETRNLALRNLLRAKMLRLATGQQMARFLRSKGVNVKTPTRAQIKNGRRRRARRIDEGAARRVPRGTRCWFYILREAELGGGRPRAWARGSSPRRSTAPWREATRSSATSRPPEARARLELQDGRPPPLRGEREEVGDRLRSATKGASPVRGHVRIAVVPRREEGLLDRPRAHPADQVPERAGLVVRP